MYEATATTADDDTMAEEGGETTEGKSIRKRIPCPFDPSQ